MNKSKSLLEDLTEDQIKFREKEKRKWQLAMRRYILEGQLSSTYAPYFGIDKEKFRKWIELQFTDSMNWSNFSKTWQFDHIIPINYFNFELEDDLIICWNFLNVHVSGILPTEEGKNRIDILGAKVYFKDIYERTGYSISNKFLEKIESIEARQQLINFYQAEFINSNKYYLEALTELGSYEFEQLNEGIVLEEVLEQKKMLNDLR